MKQTFTLFALLAAGTAQAQTSTQFFQLPPAYRTEAARRTLAVTIGTDGVMQQQRAAGVAAKSAATAHRLTGWSRYDPARKEYLDSASFTYSGLRGSRFLDEQENLRGGSFWYLSNPDLLKAGKDGAAANTTELSFRYNAANQRTEQIYRSPNFTTKSVWTYDIAGQLQSLVEFDSTSAGWIAMRRYSYQYDASGRRIKDNIADLQGGGASVMEYHYDAAGLQDTLRSKMQLGTAWVVDYLLVHAYDGAGKVQSTTNYHIDAAMALVPGERYQYSYNAASLLSGSVTSRYENGSWTPLLRDSFAYTGSKTLYTYMSSYMWSEVNKEWTGMREWVYSLNAQKQWSIEWFSTPGSAGTLEPQTKTLISYNADGLASETRTYRYDRVQKAYDVINEEEEHFQYQRYETTGVPGARQAVRLNVYPNPVTTALRLDAPEDGIGHIDVYTPGGQQVITLDGIAAGQQIDVSRLPGGVYFLQAQLKGGHWPAVVRFVKL